MRKLLFCLGLCLAFMATPAMAVVNLGLPNETAVNFDGNGVFAQNPAGSFDQLGPMAAAPGTELFGTGLISGVSDFNATPLWAPPAGLEMTFVFWDAVVTSSTRQVLDLDPINGAAPDHTILTAMYANGARLLLVTDTSPDYSPASGPGAFDLVDGEFPGSYTLESDVPDGSMFTVANDAGEEVFLDLELSGNTSRLTWDILAGSFLSGDFRSTAVEILGGTGASQFADFVGADGAAAALILTFAPGSGWMFGGDVDIQLTTVPEPATLVFLGTGLVSLFGYGMRRKMS